jgi:Protein of unknown function (DUF3618)
VTVTDETARSPEQIEAEIARTRENLADSIDVIEDKLRPANLIDAAKNRALGLLKRPDGSLDPKRAAVVAGVGLILVTYFVRRRKL